MVSSWQGQSPKCKVIKGFSLECCVVFGSSYVSDKNYLLILTDLLMMIIKYYCLKEIDDTAFKKQMHSGWWGLSRKTISLLYLRHKNFSCGIFFCFMSPPFNTTMLCNFKSFLPTERGLNLRIFTWTPRCLLVWIPSWFYFSSFHFIYSPEQNSIWWQALFWISLFIWQVLSLHKKCSQKNQWYNRQKDDGSLVVFI